MHTPEPFSQSTLANASSAFAQVPERSKPDTTHQSHQEELQNDTTAVKSLAWNVGVPCEARAVLAIADVSEPPLDSS